ncbi:MAG: cytidylate kinase family protein, partial [Acidimicrobiales bacterium]|nr:cytidylate kinase family protein [Acidimicrobiales bacterium]
MVDTGYGPAVTVSASYGAGGSVIVPRLAEALGLPFIDRLIAAGELRSQEGLAKGERETTPTGRILSYFARAASVGTVMVPDPDVDDDEAIREKSEAA